MSEPRTFSLPLRSHDGTCTVNLSISPARVPADYPRLNSTDNRRLGLHVDFFTYVAPR